MDRPDWTKKEDPEEMNKLFHYLEFAFKPEILKFVDGWEFPFNQKLPQTRKVEAEYYELQESPINSGMTKWMSAVDRVMSMEWKSNSPTESQLSRAIILTTDITGSYVDRAAELLIYPILIEDTTDNVVEGHVETIKITFYGYFKQSPIINLEAVEILKNLYKGIDLDNLEKSNSALFKYVSFRNST